VLGVRLVRTTVRVAAVVATLGTVYLGVTFVGVWSMSHRDQARASGPSAGRPDQAIVVLGAAQYDGRPSPVLAARLDHALDLWRRHLAPVMVVTGGREPGDRFTEAAASADYLSAHGVPSASVLRETTGRTSWESLAAAARLLERRGITDVVLVSDPFHSERLALISGELGLRARVSPTRTSPISGVSNVAYLGRETLAVAAGRVLGFRRLGRLERRARRLTATGVPFGGAGSAGPVR